MESQDKVMCIFAICVTAIIITISVCTYKYHANIAMYAIGKGLIQGTVNGHSSWMWIKPKGD